MESVPVVRVLIVLVNLLVFVCQAHGGPFKIEDYLPTFALPVLETDAGSVSAWNLYRANVSGNLAAFSVRLEENSVQFPGHLDSDVLGFVTGGSAQWGLVLANGRSAETKTLQAGDAFFIPREAVYWFYNNGPLPFTVVAIGDTSTSLTLGKIQRFDILGEDSVLYAFGLDVLINAFNAKEDDVAKLIYAQQARTFFKLPKALGVLSPPISDLRYDADFQFPLASSYPDVDIPEGGKIWNLAASLDSYPVLHSIGLSGILGHQEKGSSFGPGWAPSANTVFYIIKGRGKFQLTSPTASKLILDIDVVEGQIVVVPRQHGFVLIAEPEGLDWFSVADTSIPSTAFLAGKTSQFNGIPKEILAAALDVDERLVEEVFGGRNSYIILPAKESQEGDDAGDKGPGYMAL